MTDRPPDAAADDSDQHEPTQEPKPAGFVRTVLTVVREIVTVFVMASALSLVVKTWVAQAFFIPTGSMEQTLQVGDRVMVSKIHQRFTEIDRGDIVVFADPGNWLPDHGIRPDREGVIGMIQEGLTFIGLLPDPADEHLIKRVIGVAGDRVVCCDADNRITVNDTPVVEPYIHPGDKPSTLPFDITVPQGSVWVMGDHRSDSQDSRYHPVDGDGSEGSVPLERVVGRAFVTVWPLTRVGPLSDHPDVFTGVPAP